MHHTLSNLAAATLVIIGVVAPQEASAADTVRFATFNASLNRDSAGQLLSDLANPALAGMADATSRRILQAHNVAEIAQRVNADVLLINEFDFDLNGVPTASSSAMRLQSLQRINRTSRLESARRTKPRAQKQTIALDQLD